MQNTKKTGVASQTYEIKSPTQHRIKKVEEEEDPNCPGRIPRKIPEPEYYEDNCCGEDYYPFMICMYFSVAIISFIILTAAVYHWWMRHLHPHQPPPVAATGKLIVTTTESSEDEYYNGYYGR